MNLKMRHFFLLVLGIFFFTGLSTSEAQTKKKVGDATYYGHNFHGRRTSDGSRYHRDSLTCAHRTLPFGTMLKVRNLSNGREVVVKVTDRGPFRRGGVVDLSFAAAKQIDMVGAGVVRVEVEPVAGNRLLANSTDENTQSTLPELQLLDPTTGEYHTMTEWLKRSDDEREQAKAKAARTRRAKGLARAQAKKPVWRVLNNKMTAKAGK